MVQIPLDEYESIMNDNSICKRIFEHLAKAKNKHPHFCDEFMAFKSKTIISGCLNELRNIVFEKSSADNILQEEILEVYEAYMNGEKEHAIDECYDAIAVLLRMVEYIKDEK